MFDVIESRLRVVRHIPRALGALLALGMMTLAGCSDRSSSGSPAAASVSPSVMSVEITATSASVAKGTSTQLTGTAIYSNNNHADVTTDLTWTSSNAAVATVSSSGKVSTVDTGTATISVTCAVASDCGTLSASFVVTVTPAIVASIALTPPIPSVAAGTTQQFTASGTFSDNTTQNLSADLTWTSSNPKVATVSASGLATTVGAGSATIAASCAVASVCSSLSGTAALTVTPATLLSIAITPTAASVAVAATQQLVATGTYSDNSTQTLTTAVTWASSATNVASVSNAAPSQGLATGLMAGTSSISATLGAVSSTAVTLTVTAPPAEAVFYSFSGRSDGVNPYAGLLEGSDQNFYGTTSGGGANGAGTIFMITPAGIETVLYSFGSSGTDGQDPTGGLILGTDGNFYGTTYSGGANSHGTVFKITPAGVETVIWSFGSGADDGQNPYAGLIQGTDGNFYGTTYLGGALGDGTIFNITPAGVETVLGSFGSGADGQQPLAPLILGSDGHFYGTTYAGGANGDGTVFKY